MYLKIKKKQTKRKSKQLKFLWIADAVLTFWLSRICSRLLSYMSNTTLLICMVLHERVTCMWQFRLDNNTFHCEIKLGNINREGNTNICGAFKQLNVHTNKVITSMTSRTIYSKLFYNQFDESCVLNSN